MSIEAIIFDLDDTLYDETLYLKSVLRVFASMQGLELKEFPDFSAAQLRRGKGDILLTLLDILGLHDKASHDVLFEIYQSATVSISVRQGVETLLTDLKSKGKKVGILTNGVTSVQKNKVACLNLATRVDSIQYARSCGIEFEKPHPRAFLRICEDLEVNPENAVMVGDNWENDILGALSVNMQTYYVGCSNINKTKDLLNLPEWLATNES
ncbi:HAD family hydrolase [Aliiglaciecola sp. M165]|uniref:HAD family hydrolase n=1 Tax=Aliiglaciecola sp. M165 TaxID=2593649 RepID=UPI00163DAA9C|nr:HAD family hydrolase [Aliiglaciecola sp. M165]